MAVAVTANTGSTLQDNSPDPANGQPAEQSPPAAPAGLSKGAELFLEKPKAPGDYETLYTTLSELLKFHSEEGFRGVLRRVGLEDVIQMECLSRHSAVLEVSGRAGRGEIYIRDGAIVHASGCDAEGEEAFNRLLTLRGGEFRLKHFEEPPAVTIQGAWEFLLMAAARKRDEVRGNTDQVDGGGAGGTTSGGVAPGMVGLDEIPDIVMGPQPGGGAGPGRRPDRLGRAIYLPSTHLRTVPCGSPRQRLSMARGTLVGCSPRCCS